MGLGGYKIRNKEEIHFLSFAVVEWADVFSRQQYRDILVKSLEHCQNEKGLRLHAWCIMSNHVHLLVSSIENDLSSIIRDFKKFTSYAIVKAIIDNPRESRKDWLIDLFKKAGHQNSRNTTYQFWRQDNHPKEVFSRRFTVNKLAYIHNNPVEAGIVEKPEHYLYSSARDYFMTKRVGLLKIDFI